MAWVASRTRRVRLRNRPEPIPRRAPRCVGIVEDHPDCGGIEVVELTTARGLDERDDRERPEGQSDGNGEEQDAHATGAFQRVSRDEPTTLSELIGMRTAAMSGLMIPVAARPTATAL